jgi:hypothetical protein
VNICDGCRAPADDRHIRERIERLELATRFRPIHMQVLVLDAAPPARPEDYFYRAAKDRAVSSPEFRQYFDDLAGTSALSEAGAVDEESALDSFQRRGLFLAHLVECPIADELELARAIERAAPTMLKRLQVSYRPKFVAPLSPNLEQFLTKLRDAGWRSPDP